jgi:asparagine synthase (glutamine-hydrolysing)
MMFELLSKDALQKHGYVDHQVVAQWVQEHVDGRANHSHRLWTLMVFEMWHHNQRVAA